MPKFNFNTIGTLTAGILFTSIGFANYSYFKSVAQSEEQNGNSCGVPRGQAKNVSNINYFLGWFGIIVIIIAIAKISCLRVEFKC